MPIDTSMYNLKNMANPAEDYNDAYKSSIDRQEKAMSLKNLAMEQKTKEQGFQDQQAIRKASRENVDPDSGRFDATKAIAEVTKQNPMAAMQMQKMVNQYGIEGAAQHAERAQQFFANTTPETYAEQRDRMIKSGFEEFQKLPDVYIPSVIQRGLVGSSSAAQQMSMIQAQLGREMEMRKATIEFGRVPIGVGEVDQFGMKTGNSPQYPAIGPKGKGLMSPMSPEANGLNPGDVIPMGKLDLRGQEMANEQLNKAGQDFTTAKNNLLAVKNAQSLVNEAADPNEITNLMLPLLAVESAKLAAGKAPTAEEMSHMLPQNRLTAMAKSISYLTGQPEAANQGEFVEQLNRYLEDLKKNSVENIKAYHQSALDAGIRAGMSPKTAEAFKASKARELRDLSETRKHESKSSGISQQDKQAIEWAKKNPGPQADAILKANGVK